MVGGCGEQGRGRRQQTAGFGPNFSGLILAARHPLLREVADPHTSNSRGTRRLVPMGTLQIHRRHRSWLRRKLTEPFDGPTVVVTHHAPHRKSLASRYAEDWSSGGFVNEMRPEFFKVPVLWVHGHTHGSFDYEVDDCREISNPRGYLNWHGEFENKAFNPGLVVEVDSSPAVNGVRLDKELLKLARQAFGEGAHAWLGQPHVLLGGPGARQSSWPVERQP